MSKNQIVDANHDLHTSHYTREAFNLKMPLVRDARNSTINFATYSRDVARQLASPPTTDSENRATSLCFCFPVITSGDTYTSNKECLYISYLLGSNSRNIFRVLCARVELTPEKCPVLYRLET